MVKSRVSFPARSTEPSITCVPMAHRMNCRISPLEKDQFVIARDNAKSSYKFLAKMCEFSYGTRAVVARPRDGLVLVQSMRRDAEFRYPLCVFLHSAVL